MKSADSSTKANTDRRTDAVGIATACFVLYMLHNHQLIVLSVLYFVLELRTEPHAFVGSMRKLEI